MLIAFVLGLLILQIPYALIVSAFGRLKTKFSLNDYQFDKITIYTKMTIATIITFSPFLMEAIVLYIYQKKYAINGIVGIPALN